MKDCIFCQIAAKKTPAEIEYEDKEILAFRDINPKAPIHILIIPKKHIESVNSVQEKDAKVLGKLLVVAKKIAKDKNLDQTGYRLIINCGKHAGQIVDHLHLHLLGGKHLGPMVCQ